jgi:membrane-associated protease RseP (regulator of RpoE activity)
MPFPEPLPLPPFKFEEPLEGALVTNVEPKSPAVEAGIEVGDIITAVDGLKIDEGHPLRDLILEHEPREKITLTLSRGGESREIQVTLGETRNEGKAIPYLGIHYRSIKGQGFFHPQRFDLGRPLLPKLNHLFRRFLRQIPLPLPTM